MDGLTWTKLYPSAWAGDKNLDPSYEMDLDFLDYFEGNIQHLITKKYGKLS